jgi:hypothetical protein
MLENRYLYQSFVNTYGVEVLSRYCFESELVTIPNTDMYLQVEAEMWIIYSDVTESLDLIHHKDFISNYTAQDKIANNYLEFVVDSINSDYSPVVNNLDEVLIETAEKFIEKEISLSFGARLRLIWDLISGKKINISKY